MLKTINKLDLTSLILLAAFSIPSGVNADSNPVASDFWTELRAEAPKVTPYTVESPLPLDWDSPRNPERKLWAEYGYSVINEVFDDLDKATDINQFCPNYAKLTNRDQKIQTWMAIFIGIAHWESSWNPADHTFEDNTPDLVTQRPVLSEGLMQISYQDTIQWKYAHCPLDWQKDQTLPPDDLHRSILNPFINLGCAIRIEAGLIRDHQSMNHSPYGYWSTLARQGFSHGKARSIGAEVTKALPFCGPPLKGQFFEENLTRFNNLKINRKIVKFWRRAFTSSHHTAVSQDQIPGVDCPPETGIEPIQNLSDDLGEVLGQ